MTAPCKIDREAWYDARTLSEHLDVGHDAVGRARKSGELRSTRRAGKFLFLGEWVFEWLTRDSQCQESKAVFA